MIVSYAGGRGFAGRDEHLCILDLASTRNGLFDGCSNEYGSYA